MSKQTETIYVRVEPDLKAALMRHLEEIGGKQEPFIRRLLIRYLVERGLWEEPSKEQDSQSENPKKKR